MAQRTVLQLIDDLDGTEADLTVRFGLDGQNYEIELSEVNAKALREALTPYVNAGRRAGGQSPQRNARRLDNNAQGYGSYNPRVVRAWARQNGIDAGERGRIPVKVVEAWREATS